MTKKMIVALAVEDWMQEEADALRLEQEAQEEESFAAIAEIARLGRGADLMKVDDWLMSNLDNPHWDEVRSMYFDYPDPYEERIDAENREWLRNPANWESEIFSDIFKDVYGFRPRFHPSEFFGGGC